MKQIQFILYLLFFILPNLTISGQTLDTINRNGNHTAINVNVIADETSQFDETDDFSPGLFFFALIGVAIVLFSIGIGIAIIVLFLILLFGLVTFGVLSTSIIVGINKKSFSKGFKTFIILFSTICGSLICGMLFFSINEYYHWWSRMNSTIIGLSSGLFAGLLFGISTYYIIRYFTNYFKKKLNLESKPTVI